MPCGGTALDLTDFQSPSTCFGPHDRPHHAPCVPLEPTHIEFTLSFDLNNRSVVGVATHHVRARRSSDSSTLTLNAEDFVHVEVPDHDFTYDGHVIDIHVKNVVKDDTYKIAIRYEVCKPTTGLIFSSEGQGTFVVSDHETERARYWLPLIDHPVVRTTVLFNLSTPAVDNLTMLANGFLREETVKDDVKTSTWVMEQRTPSYLLCVAIGKFLCVEDTPHEDKPISYFAPVDSRMKHTVENLKASFGRTPEMIAFMEKKVGVPLPWPKYFQFAAGEIGGAMENSSLVSYDEAYVYKPRDAGIRQSAVDSTVLHELAHTWFGDMVVCADFLHSFLKESFATLMSYEWAHHVDGEDEFQNRLTGAALSYQTEVATAYARPVVYRSYESSWQLFDCHIYPGGAWRLHMLREKLGDGVFWAGINDYLRKHAWSVVETDDLRRALENASGESLTEFFDQWFYGRGYPILEASFSYSKGMGIVNVKQTQVDKKKDIGVFSFTLEVAVETKKGEWSTHYIKMCDGERNGRIVFALPSRPTQIVLDPNMKVLHKLDKFSGLGDDLLLRSLVHAPTYSGRRMAAKMLHDGGSKRGQAALEKALVNDPAYGLRCTIAADLGNGKKKSGLEALINALSSEKDLRVIKSIVLAIGQYENEKALNALRKFISNSTEMTSESVLDAALYALGRPHGTDDIELFINYLTHEEGPHARSWAVHRGAANALSKTKTMMAATALMNVLKEGPRRLPPRVRGAVARSLVSCMDMADMTDRRTVYKTVYKVYEDEKEEISWGLRFALVSTLASFADVKYDGNIFSEFEKSASNQNKPTARRVGERARKKRDEDKNGKMVGASILHNRIETRGKEIDELKSKVEALESKFEALRKAETANGLTAGKNGTATSDDNHKNADVSKPESKESEQGDNNQEDIVVDGTKGGEANVETK